MHNYQFTKQYRLLKPQDYDFVFAKANKVASKYFIILSRKNTLNYSRIGLVIAKKNVKKAVFRNQREIL